MIIDRTHRCGLIAPPEGVIIVVLGVGGWRPLLEMASLVVGQFRAEVAADAGDVAIVVVGYPGHPTIRAGESSAS